MLPFQGLGCLWCLEELLTVSEGLAPSGPGQAGVGQQHPAAQHPDTEPQRRALVAKPGHTGLQGPPPLARAPCAATAVMLSVTGNAYPPGPCGFKI